MAEAAMPTTEETKPVAIERSSLDIPSNSDKAAQATKAHEPRVKKVTTGNVSRRKESTASKFKTAFFGEDVVSVKDYVIFDVMIPALKATISDMIGNGVNVLLFGEPARNKRNGKEARSYASYYRSDRDRDVVHRRSNTIRNAFDFDDIVFDTRVDAEETISSLQDLAFDYGQATVADLYDLAGISATFTDDKWGWLKGDLRSATVRRIRDGYLLDLPRPTRLD